MTDTGDGAPLSHLAPPPQGRWRREAVVTAVAFTLCLLGGVVGVGVGDDDTVAPPPVVAYVLATVSCAVLPARHRAPLATLAATTVCGLLLPVLGLLPNPLIVAPAVVAAYSCALTARTERRAAGTVSFAAAVLLVASVPFFEADSWQDTSRMATVAAFPLVAGVLGRSTHHRRAYVAAVEERAQRAEETRDSEARQRVGEERVRIARDLHDAVAHQITLANAQASVASHLFDARPEQARQSLRELVRTTGDALDDLRATVGLLRQTGDTAAPAGPPPGLARLPTLLASFRRAGLDVAVDEEGTPRPLAPGVDLTAYRIVQEALTNVAKHAGTGTARVGLVWGRDRVAVTVSDDGAGSRTGAGLTGTGGTGAGGGVPVTPAMGERAPGYGLIGMRERASAIGGRLSAGSRPEGGFLVSSELPAPPVDGTPAEAPSPTAPAPGVPADGGAV
ncbi:sensor histidine kinase [Streptomyces phytohabitans]|uniref:sensor histidine kinase n=1 Tax=Streptomyces phytohabitans TaxID=1150371 RepID=UPI00345C56E3